MVAASRETDASPRVLEEHERMRLAGADAAAFLEAVAASLKPAARLVEAMRRCKSIAGCPRSPLRFHAARERA